MRTLFNNLPAVPVLAESLGKADGKIGRNESGEARESIRGPDSAERRTQLDSRGGRQTFFGGNRTRGEPGAPGFWVSWFIEHPPKTFGLEKMKGGEINEKSNRANTSDDRGPGFGGQLGLSGRIRAHTETVPAAVRDMEWNDSFRETLGYELAVGGNGGRGKSASFSD